VAGVGIFGGVRTGQITGIKKTLNLAIQGFRYLVPETESNFCLWLVVFMGCDWLAP